MNWRGRYALVCYACFALAGITLGAVFALRHGVEIALKNEYGDIVHEFPGIHIPIYDSHFTTFEEWDLDEGLEADTLYVELLPQNSVAFQIEKTAYNYFQLMCYLEVNDDRYVLNARYVPNNETLRRLSISRDTTEIEQTYVDFVDNNADGRVDLVWREVQKKDYRYLHTVEGWQAVGPRANSTKSAEHLPVELPSVDEYGWSEEIGAMKTRDDAK